ncbi:hypothetical protein ACFFT4_22170, partial [Cohnella cellulosilytica]
SKHVKKRLLSHMNSQNYRVGEKALCLATVNRRLLADRYASQFGRPTAFSGLADRYASRFERPAAFNGLADRYASQFGRPAAFSGLADRYASNSSGQLPLAVWQAVNGRLKAKLPARRRIGPSLDRCHLYAGSRFVHPILLCCTER